MNDPAPKETPKGGHTKFSMPASGSQLAGSIPRILPHERVFPIQIGCELFKLSGASLSSDAPSYFSQYFQCQIKQAEEQRQDVTAAIRTLYIDRDPVTFKDISLHLQGYHIKPRDGQHFVRLFADAQFYTLPKLMSQLYEESIFVAIGGHEFQLDRDLFREPGNSPNFFSLGFAAFFTSPDQIFPGLERQNLIRPPSIVPPVVAQRSADVFREIMQLLRGYPVHIRDEAHRASLLRDCRYFNFKKVEQKLIPHNISYNQARRREEIVLRVEDILKSGISIFHEAFSITNLGARATTPSTSTPPITGPGPGSSLPNGSTSMNHHTNNNSNNHKLSNTPPDPHSGAWVHYARPYEDDKPYELVLEIGGESTKLHTSIMRAEFFGSVKARVAKLLEVVATKLNLPPTTQPLGLLMASGGASSQPATPGNTPLSEDLVRVIIEPDAHVLLDGKVFEGFRSWSNSSSSSSVTGPSTVATTTTAADVDEMTHAMSTSSPIGNATRGHPESSPVSSSAATFSNGVAAAGGHQPQQHHHPSRKRKRLDANSTWTAADGTAVPDEWVVRTGQWRLRIQSSRGGKSAVECVLVAVRLDACSSERARNAQRGFLRG